MTLSMKCHKVNTLLKHYWLQFKCRRFATKSSSEIREEFLKFFINEHKHEYVRSSPVVPFCDPTVPFVNAGMNQFKGILLGKVSSPYKRVVNSQKCIRVSGKHNDLDSVGTDGTHHTFFEMLGNWSFGDYYKEDACKMAWNLLTGPYGFDADRLMVTYFGGNQNLGLEPDLETRDIWLRLGIPNDRILPCDMKDNFWEMGSEGPCGPCTEIHFLNSKAPIEIWNIVFIQYQRQSNGNMVRLPKCHVDTGMGLERIATLLQNKTSNYDSDLFAPLMDIIHKKSGKVPPYTGEFGKDANVDNNYRILADHARMISVCLADNVFPCSNLRLRHILRKTLTLSKNIFECNSDLLISLYDQVALSLGATYPELYIKREAAKQIILHEEHSLSMLQTNVEKGRKTLIETFPEVSKLPDELYPGLIEGYKQFKEEMKKIQADKIPGYLAFKLYDSFGLDDNMINSIARVNKLNIDEESFRELKLEHKLKHKAVISKKGTSGLISFMEKVNSLLSKGLIITDDTYKYDYKAINDEEYIFPKLKSKLLVILDENGNIVDSIDVDSSSNYFLIFDKSNYYCEEGGQGHDIGVIEFENVIFEVENISKLQDVILHYGKIKERLSDEPLRVNCYGDLSIDSDNRLELMQHHSAVHVLNAAVRMVLPKSVVCQLGSKVTRNGLVLDFGVYGGKLSVNRINQAQQLVREACAIGTPVVTHNIDSQKLNSLKDVTMIPGEIYPETNIRMVEMKFSNDDTFVSRELCCGTHVAFSNHIKNFTVTSVRGAGGFMPSFRAVVGKIAIELNNLASDADNLKKELEENEISHREAILERILAIKNKLNELTKGDGTPFDIRANILETLSSIEKLLKERNDQAIIELVQTEIMTVIAEADKNNKEFMVHFLACSYLLEPGTLSLTTALQTDITKPILVMGCASGILKATCRVPQNYVSENFNAKKWIESIIPVFKTSVTPPVNNQNIHLIAHMKGKKVSLINCEALVGEAVKQATEFANQNCVVNKENDWSDETINKKRNLGC